MKRIVLHVLRVVRLRWSLVTVAKLLVWNMPPVMCVARNTVNSQNILSTIQLVIASSVVVSFWLVQRLLRGKPLLIIKPLMNFVVIHKMEQP